MSASLFPVTAAAALVFADGTVFRGKRFGASGEVIAEVVFNTAMTGYQEVLTDPSYSGQIVVFTTPHIGNVGSNDNDCESRGVFAAGLVLRDDSPTTSNFRSTQSLTDYLTEAGVAGISGVDTRHLTRYLRSHGAQNACLVAGDNPDLAESVIAAALQRVRAAPSMEGLDLAQQVSCQRPYKWQGGGLWNTAKMAYDPAGAERYRVVVLDFGVKHNILRHLAARGCSLTVLPARTDLATVLAQRPDGVFFSNGPGDPAACGYAIDLASQLLAQRLPFFGICLGHQIMALASGAKTVKMKFGHHGGNHPVQDVRSGQVFITAQNHGFAVDAVSLPPGCEQTHISLFDGSCQGLRWRHTPALSFQGHPEASPGPHEIGVLFDEFVALMAGGPVS